MVNGLRSSILDTRYLRREKKSLNSKAQLWMLVPFFLVLSPRGEGIGEGKEQDKGWKPEGIAGIGHRGRSNELCMKTY